MQVIDTLAEVTRHQDRDLIERSLVKTLAEIVDCLELRLYRIVRMPPEIELLLVDQVTPRQKVIAALDGCERPVPDRLCASIIEALESGEIVTNLEAQPCVIYPIEDNQGGIQAVLVQFVVRVSFDDQRMTHGLLRIYANYLALIDESQRDKLTSLLNRETLDDTIARLMTHRHIHGREKPNKRRQDANSHWLGLLDIDHFKRINDSCGHLFGDEVLILVANLMRDTLREEDLIFRFGGEEFVVIIDTPSQQLAWMVFERLRKTIENHPFPQIGRVTARSGIVEIANQAGTAMVIGNADKALYHAKNTGRNRVEVYEELVAQGECQGSDTPRTGTIDLF